MKIPRRIFLRLAAGTVALPALWRGAWAQSYPSRPVRWIVGIAPGGASDIFARLMGQWLSERLGQQFIIENRPGGGGNIAAEAVVRARPDGYTLLQVTSTNTINASIYEKLNYDLVRDIAPIAGIASSPNVVAVHPSFPARTVHEFIAYARDNPGQINMATPGAGTTAHVAGELFKLMAGIDMVHVPYRGGAPALTDLLGGQVQVMFVTPVAVTEHIQSGKVRALAVTTGKRLEMLPDVPTVAEYLPGYEATAIFGVGAPADTPADIVATLNREINAGLANSKLKAKLAELSGIALPGSPGDFGKLIADDIAKWAKVARFARIKPD